MGYEQAAVTITASLIRNNSYKNEVHNELWKEFMDRVSMIASIPKYKEININIGFYKDEE